MKNLIPFSLAMSLATAGIFYSESQAKALTWSFDYTSDTIFNSGTGYGSQSGSFVEASTGSNGTFPISSFQFNHTDLGSADFDTTGGSSFVGSPTVTITGGAVTDINNLVVNNAAGTASFEMLFSLGFSQATIYDNVNGGSGMGMPIDGSDFNGVSFSQTGAGAGADYEHNPVPAVLILSIGFAIKKLSQKLRDKKNRDSSRNGDAK